MLYNFFLKNLFLILIFFILLFFLFIFEIKNILSYKSYIDVNKIIELINHENAILVDIRNELEFKKLHLLNSINMPFESFEKNIIKLKKYRLKTIIIVYSKKNLAINSMKILKKNDFLKVFLIENGIESWIKNDLPVKRG